jgi:prevent-host-death family protein
MKVTSTEFQQNVGRYQNAALTEPVIITKNGRDKNVLISALAFETLLRRRIARRMDELDEDSLKAIGEAKVPERFAYLDKLDLG